MGFSMSLIILEPNRYSTKNGSCIVWTPQGLMSGYASWPAQRGEMPRGKELADLCMLSWLLGNAMPSSGKLSRKVFAPIFGNPEEVQKDDKRTFFIFSVDSWLDQNLDLLKDGSQIVMPFWSDYGCIGFPGLDNRKRHNKVLELSNHHYRRWLARNRKTYDPALSHPYIWRPCSFVARSLNELEKGDGHHAQRELRKDTSALLLVQARRRYLFSIGKIGYRVLFAFERSFQIYTTPYL